jgi:hypothetical protein
MADTNYVKHLTCNCGVVGLNGVRIVREVNISLDGSRHSIVKRNYSRKRSRAVINLLTITCNRKEPCNTRSAIPFGSLSTHFRGGGRHLNLWNSVTYNREPSSVHPYRISGKRLAEQKAPKFLHVAWLSACAPRIQT